MRINPSIMFKYFYEEDIIKYVNSMYSAGYMYGHSIHPLMVLVVDDII